MYVFYVSWRLWEPHLHVFYVSWRLRGVPPLTKLCPWVGPLKKDLTCVGGSELGSYELRSELEVELGSYEFK